MSSLGIDEKYIRRKYGADELVFHQRRKIRYWCFRFRTEEEGGPKADGAPVGLRGRLEDAEGFLGWGTFAETWDVAKDDPSRIVPRKESVHDEWTRALEKSVPTLPGAE